MPCPSCQATVADDDRFCAYCGLNLRSARPPTSEGRSTPDIADEDTDPDGPADADVTTPTRPEMGPDLTGCPSCGAGNSPHRALCGRCGADLETGRMPPTASAAATARPPTAVAAPTGPPRRARSRAALAAVLILGAVVGTAVGTVLWLRFRPQPVQEAAPVFDAGVYNDDPGELVVAGASASSTLEPRGTIRYDAGLAIDGDPTTAWNEGAEGLGAGVTLRLRLDEPAWVAQVSFRNGYQKDAETFRDNARVGRLLMTFDDGTAFEVALHDRSGEQIVLLPEPELTSSLTLEMLQAAPGEQYEDLALSEVTPVGWGARGVDRVSVADR